MRIFALILILLLVGILAGCGNPRVEVTELDGVAGTNNVFRIKIDPNARCPQGTYAQELWEARFKRSPEGLATLVDSSAQRRMEIMGHEVETQAAVIYCDADAATYRAEEARDMFLGYQGLFAGTNPGKIAEQMSDKSKEAKRWVDRNASLISALRV